MIRLLGLLVSVMVAAWLFRWIDRLERAMRERQARNAEYQQALRRGKRRLAQLEAVEESKARVMLGRVHGQEWE